MSLTTANPPDPLPPHSNPLNQDAHRIPARAQHIIRDDARVERILTIPLEFRLRLPQIVVELARDLRNLGSILALLSLLSHIDLVLGARVRDQALLVPRLEAEQVGDVAGEQPLLGMVDRQREHEVFLLEDLQLGEGGGRRGVQARGLVDDEGLVVVLQVVDGGMLRRGEVDAHGDGVDQLVQRADGREGLEARTAVTAE